MIVYKQIVYMSKKEHKEAVHDLFHANLYGEDEEHVLTATFPDGKEMDIVGYCYGNRESFVEPILYEYVGDDIGWNCIARGGNGFRQSYEGEWMLHDWQAKEPREYWIKVMIV